MKGKTALFLAFVSLLFGCPPGGESGTVTLGEVSVTPVRGYNTTATFELKAAVQTTVEATLTIVVKDETGAEAANSGAMKVKAGNSTQTFSTKIEKFGNMKATFTLAAAGVETQTKSVDFEVLEGGVPSAEFGWPATGVYAGARITISMADVKADTAGTGEGTFKLSQAAFTMKKGGSPFEFAFPPLLNDDATLNQNVQITLPSEHGNYSITLSVTNTNNQTREKTVEFALADKVNVASINAEPSTFSDLIVNDTVKVTLTFTGEGEQTPSDINVNWDEGSNYSVELVEQTATTAVYNLTVLSSSLSTAKATAADGSGKSVTISFAGIEGNKVPGTKTVNNREVELKWVENFNKIDDAFFEKWRAEGWRSNEDKLKRFYWRPEALEMTELDGRQVFTMFTRKWGSRPGEDTTKTPYYPGQDQSSSNGNNQAGEQWIAGGIHLQDNIVFGYIEARVRTARNSNQHWDAFWSYNSHKADGYTMEYEFDCMEAITATDLDVTTHFWDWTTPGVPHGKFYTTKTKKHSSVDLNNKWYKLALLWTPEKVIYYAGHDTLAPIAGFERDGTGLYGYGNLDTEKKEIPLITRWKQGFKFTTELGAAYGGSGRPETGTEDKYYIDYFAVYEIPVTQAQLAADIANGTASFDREQAGNTASAFADIASAGNKIYVNVTPASGYLTESVTATWTGGSAELTKESEGRYYLEVTENMPQYFDFTTQEYGEKVTIKPVFTQNATAPELTEVTLSADSASGFSGETITVTEKLTPADAVVTNVTVNKGIYERTTKTLTLPENADDEAITETVTFTYTTKGNKTVTATLAVTVYPNTYVRRNGVVYQPMKTVEDFSGTNTDVTFANKTADAWSDTAQPVITVNSLQPDGTQSDIMTITGVPDNSDNNCLVEMTINYSDTSAVRSIIAITNGANRPFWLLRNTHGGGIGNGTAFRAGPNSGDSNSTYTLRANQDEVLGYLINGATQDAEAQFFFNGVSKTVEMSNTTTITKAPSITDNSFKFSFNREKIGSGPGENPISDPGTITLKKIVFYKPVTE